MKRQWDVNLRGYFNIFIRRLAGPFDTQAEAIIWIDTAPQEPGNYIYSVDPS